jgi:hypothetical protein
MLVLYITLGCKGFAVTNALAYWARSEARFSTMKSCIYIKVGKTTLGKIPFLGAKCGAALLTDLIEIKEM